jgi:hypothetical protein
VDYSARGFCVLVSVEPFVCQPLHVLRCSDVAKPLLDALNHHVPDHLAGNPGRGCHPVDDFAIMAVQRAKATRTWSA